MASATSTHVIKTMGLLRFLQFQAHLCCFPSVSNPQAQKNGCSLQGVKISGLKCSILFSCPRYTARFGYQCKNLRYGDIWPTNSPDVTTTRSCKTEPLAPWAGRLGRQRRRMEGNSSPGENSTWGKCFKGCGVHQRSQSWGERAVGQKQPWAWRKDAAFSHTPEAGIQHGEKAGNLSNFL